jgi:hypothetical protein
MINVPEEKLDEKNDLYNSLFHEKSCQSCKKGEN